jgi:hypothetical protein
MEKKIADKIDEKKTQNLAAGDKFRLHEIPARRFMDQAQYVENKILPLIEKREGKESVQYKYFQEIFDSLLYSIMVKDREGNLLNKLQQLQQINIILTERLAFCEKELLKYATMEDLYLTEAHIHIANGVKQRAEDLLTKKPGA